METKHQGYFERGLPRIDKDKCIDCGLCAKLCGGQPLSMVDDKVVIDPDSAMGCLGCGQCMAVCPTGAVTVTGRRLSAEAITGLPSRDSIATTEQLESLFMRRRSIRSFKPVEVERKVVDRILRIASTAPMGIPPSEVGIVVFHGRSEVKAFSDDVWVTFSRTVKMLNPAMLALYRIFSSKIEVESLKEFVLPLWRTMEEERSKGGDPILYGAPVAFLFHRSPYSEPADAHIAATYAMIAAESMGLGTCLIGIVAPFMGRDRKILERYGIPKGNELSLVLLLGHPSVAFKKGLRRDFASVKYHAGRPTESS